MNAAAPGTPAPTSWPGLVLWKSLLAGRWVLVSFDEVLGHPVARVWAQLGERWWWRLASEQEEREILRAAVVALAAPRTSSVPSPA